MKFPRVDEAFKACAEHLDSTGTRNTEIESHLVNNLLSIIYAEYEQEIRRLVMERGAKNADVHSRAFMEHAALRLVRSIKLRDLSGTLKRFHTAFSDQFKSEVENTPASTAYNNILTNRHSVAHARGSNMTFRELGPTYTASLDILRAFARALDLS